MDPPTNQSEDTIVSEKYIFNSSTMATIMKTVKRLHTYIHALMYVCVHTCVRTYIHTCVSAYVRMWGDRRNWRWVGRGRERESGA